MQHLRLEISISNILAKINVLFLFMKLFSTRHENKNKKKPLTKPVYNHKLILSIYKLFHSIFTYFFIKKKKIRATFCI